jgi:hypothetical protein
MELDPGDNGEVIIRLKGPWKCFSAEILLLLPALYSPQAALQSDDMPRPTHMSRVSVTTRKGLAGYSFSTLFIYAHSFPFLT